MRYVVLLGAFMVGLVPYFERVGAWDQAFSTDNISVLFGIIGAILVAWAGESPLQKRFYDGRK